jgi:chorismate--pyruvate lyase
MNRPHYAAVANWNAHINRHAVSAQMRDWLTNRQSLTSRLVACCEQFRVQRLQQQVARCLTDEFEVIGLPRPIKVMERDVLLRCDDSAVVYAHTVLPLSANASHWPLFASLGNKSLGTTLFNDPLVTRGALHFSQLAITHPLMRRIGGLNLPGVAATSLHARRSVFTRHGSRLLVTEVFLPSIHSLNKNRLKDLQ